MPRFEVTSPEGKRFEVDAPEGATHDEVIAYAQQNFASPRRRADDINLDPTAGNSFAQNALIGAGKFAQDFLHGAQQRLGIGDQNTLQTEIDERRSRDAPLMRTSGGVVGNVAPALLTAAFPGANTLAGATAIGAISGLVQPTASGESVAGNVAASGALGAAGQKLGQFAGNAITSKLSSRAAGRATEQATNAPRDAVLAAGQQAGLTVPPTQVNPALMNRALEGLAGKLSTAQAASAKNAPVVNRLVAEAVGLPGDQPISRGALANLRAQTGKAYEAVKSTGTVQADQTFTDALDQLVAKYQGAGKSFPGLAKNEVADLVGSLRVSRFGADSAVDAISVLRERADDAFRAGNKSLGKATRGAADAMEDLLGRHLQVVGAPKELLDAYRGGRQLIAKTYTIDGALNSATGNINAAKLAADLKRGVPLTDEMRTVAQFAGAFPKATQTPERMGSLPGVSPLDYAVTAARAAGGDPSVGRKMVEALVSLGVRPAARSVILSHPYQGAMTMPSYTSPVVDRAAEALSIDDRIARAMQALLPSTYNVSGAGR